MRLMSNSTPTIVASLLAPELQALLEPCLFAPALRPSGEDPSAPLLNPRTL
jgi:hypothetical protein